MKFITPVLLAGILSLTMFSCKKSNDVVVADTTAHKVNIQAGQFSPNTLTMYLGSTVSWTNTDTETHSIVSEDGISFNSGNIVPGGTFSFKPLANGMYSYYCGLHASVKGVLSVVTR